MARKLMCNVDLSYLINVATKSMQSGIGCPRAKRMHPSPYGCSRATQVGFQEDTCRSSRAPASRTLNRTAFLSLVTYFFVGTSGVTPSFAGKNLQNLFERGGQLPAAQQMYDEIGSNSNATTLAGAAAENSDDFSAAPTTDAKDDTSKAPTPQPTGEDKGDPTEASPGGALLAPVEAQKDLIDVIQPPNL